MAATIAGISEPSENIFPLSDGILSAALVPCVHKSETRVIIKGLK